MKFINNPAEKTTAATDIVLAIVAYKITPGAWLMATGVFCSIIAAAIQTRKSVSLTFIWRFDHNGIYHLVQVLGLMFLLIGLRWSVQS